MSLNIPQIHVASVMDPRLEINREREYVALKGSLVNSFQQFNATNVSPSSVQITCNPPNRGIAISRLILQRAVFRITVTGTNTTQGPLLVNGQYAPRAMPLTMVQNAVQMTVNNVTITQSPMQQYWGALMWLGDNDFHNRFGQYSLSPSYLDQFQSYEEGTSTVRNPLAAYGSNSFENTRGGYSGMTIIPGNNPDRGLTSIVELTTVEPILLSPFVSGHGSNTTSCLAGVQNMSYQCNFGDLTRLLSLTKLQGTAPGGISINSISVEVLQYSLLFNYLTPDPLYPVPRNLSSSYFSIVSYPSIMVGPNGGPIPAGTMVQASFQSVQLTSIPRRVIIFARERDADRTAFTPDTYLAIPKDVNPLSLTWNNNQFLNQATTQDLYNMSYKNGCQMSYSQYTNFVGSIIVLDLGVDVGLMSNQAPGVLGNYQMGLTCQFVNTSNRSLNAQMFVIVVYEGVMNVVDGNCTTQIGILSDTDVLNSQPVPGVTYRAQKDVYGGNFFDSLKRAFGSVNKFLKNNQVISNTLGSFPNAIPQAASQLAKVLGYGAPMHRRRRAVRGGDLHDEEKQAPRKRGVKYASDLADDYSDEQDSNDY